jgi:hypothetical protein
MVVQFQKRQLRSMNVRPSEEWTLFYLSKSGDPKAPYDFTRVSTAKDALARVKSKSSEVIKVTLKSADNRHLEWERSEGIEAFELRVASVSNLKA